MMFVSYDILTKLFNIKNVVPSNISKIYFWRKKELDLTNIELHNLNILIQAYTNKLYKLDNNIEYSMNQVINYNILLSTLNQYDNVNGNHELTILFINKQIKWINTAIRALNTNPNIHNLDLVRNYINVIYNILDIKYIEYIDYTNKNNGSNINDIVAIYKSYLYTSLESYKYLNYLLKKYDNEENILEHLTKDTKKIINIEKEQVQLKLSQFVAQKKKLENSESMSSVVVNTTLKVCCPKTQCLDTSRSPRWRQWK